MRRNPCLQLATLSLATALLPPALAAARPTSVVLVLEAKDGQVELRSARASDRAGSLPEGPLVMDEARTRFGDRPGPGGTWEGGPERVDGSASRLVVPLSSAGQSIDVRLGGRSFPILVPDLAGDERGDPEDPVPEYVSIRDSGDPEARQDLVFLPDGYRLEERQAFLDDVDAVLAYLETLEPYDRYLPLVNVHAVFLPSAESGADHLEEVPQTHVDTALDCHFGAYGIDRLLDCDPAAVLELAAAAPGDDAIVVLVNDPAYGGSGGDQYAVASNGEEMVRVASHEMAHSDGGLADEYDYGIDSGGGQEPWPNCHWEAVGTPWQPWIDEASPGVAAFEQCRFSDYFRPTEDSCLMRSIENGFCVVCREQLTRAILRHVGSMIEATSPADGVVQDPVGGSDTVTLSLDLLEPAGEPLTVIWTWVEGEVELFRGPGLATVEIGGRDLDEGVQTIRARVEDRIGWVLSDVPSAMAGQVDFQVEFLEGPLADDDGGSGCQGTDDGDDGSGCGRDEDRDGFARSSVLVPLLLLARRRRG